MLRTLLILVPAILMLVVACSRDDLNRNAGSEAGSSQGGVAIVDAVASVDAVVSDSPAQPLRPRQTAITPSDRWLQHELGRADARADDWSTEALSERIQTRLDQLATAIDTGLDASTRDLFTADVAHSPLCPADLKCVFESEHLQVWRAPRQDRLDRRRGTNSIEDELKTWSAAFSQQGHTHFKIVGVDLAGDRASTTLLVESHGPGKTAKLQRTATWRCVWSIIADREPLLASIDVEAFEEVHFAGSHPLFRDCAGSVIGTNDQLSRGGHHWSTVIDWRLGIDIVGTHGLAIGDVNGDGLDDLYVCEPGGLPNRLFVQQPDGTALERSAEMGVDWLEPTHSALFLDLDNDGDQDLCLACGQFLQALENDGQGHFKVRRIGRLPALSRSLVAADYDLDADLDLFVCGYFGTEAEATRNSGLARPIPYHDANNGGQNVLLRNEGDWRFTEFTRQAGLDANNRRFSYAASWEDFDNDGDLDLYVANDFGRNNLYRNDAGRFTDIAAVAGVEDISAGMSVSWGDYDRDGWVDLYVGNMFSSAGNRIAYQRKFAPGVADETRASMQRHARGNSLFQNLGDGTFRDVSVELGVAMGRWAWGSNFADVNNDGWDDILVANGMLTGADDSGDL